MKKGIDTLITIKDDTIHFSCAYVKKEGEMLKVFQYFSISIDRNCVNDLIEEIPCDSIYRSPERYIIPYLDSVIHFDSIINNIEDFIIPYPLYESYLKGVDVDSVYYPLEIFHLDTIDSLCYIGYRKAVYLDDTLHYDVVYYFNMNKNTLKTNFLTPYALICNKKYKNLKIKKIKSLSKINRKALLSTFYYFLLSEAAFHNLMIYDKLYVGCLCKKQTLKNEEISILVDNLKKIKLLYKENKVVYDSMLWEMQEELNIFDGENIVSEVLKHFEDYPINDYVFNFYKQFCGLVYMKKTRKLNNKNIEILKNKQ